MKSAELLELSKLTNRELKNILHDNQIKNYSKLNKKNLVKKVNQFINKQSGGNSSRRNNKKYTLKELVGGVPEDGETRVNNSINLPNINSSKPSPPPPPQIRNNSTGVKRNNAVVLAGTNTAVVKKNNAVVLAETNTTGVKRNNAVVLAANNSAGVKKKNVAVLAANNQAAIVSAQNPAANNQAAIVSAQNPAVNNPVAIAPQKGNNKNDCPACTIQ